MKITIDDLVDIQGGPFKFVRKNIEVSDEKSIKQDFGRALNRIPDRLVLDLKRTPESKFGEYYATIYIDTPTFKRGY